MVFINTCPAHTKKIFPHIGISHTEITVAPIGPLKLHFSATLLAKHQISLAPGLAGQC